MDFNLTPEEEAFRSKLRDWLADNMKEIPKWRRQRDVIRSEADSKEYQAFSLWWHRKLYDAGYVGLAWPKEYGGGGATVMEQAIFNEEMAKARAPTPANGMGLNWVGPMIIANGSDELRKRFLNKILTAEEIWCTLYSEPGSGSDLASVQTRAVEEGDEFVINGQKVWTTQGANSDWGVCLVRTDPDAYKHRGLSYLLVNMHDPGFSFKPIKQITGGAGFYETFIDNVRTPRNYILGEKNKGWYVVMGALEFERSMLGQTAAHENSIKELIRMVKRLESKGQPVSKDPMARQRLAQLFIEVNIARYIGLRNLTTQIRGGRPGSEGVILPIFVAEWNQRMADFALQLWGPYGQLLPGSKRAADGGRWAQGYLSARSSTIGGGTSEVRRNVIAMRVLGLPRSY